MENLYYEVIEGGVNEFLGFTPFWSMPASRAARRGGVICFTESGKVVGSLEWYTDHGLVHHAAGTFVNGDYQGRGIATEMWKLALEDSAAEEVHVDVVSDRGMTLAKSLEQKFPHLRWSITDCGNRKLRKMKGRKGARGKDPARNRQLYHPGGY